MDEHGAERFETFVDTLAGVIGHADRVRPLRDYCMGLLTPAERKRVEPLAAVTTPSRVSATRSRQGTASTTTHHLSPRGPS